MQVFCTHVHKVEHACTCYRGVTCSCDTHQTEGCFCMPRFCKNCSSFLHVVTVWYTFKCTHIYVHTLPYSTYQLEEKPRDHKQAHISLALDRQKRNFYATLSFSFITSIRTEVTTPSKYDPIHKSLQIIFHSKNITWQDFIWEGDREWDCWMLSPTQWTWTWANSGRRWGTGKTMGLQRGEYDLVTEQPHK